MNQDSFIYKFLLSPRFRKWRYLVLVTFFTFISLDQAYYDYKNIFHLMGYNVYWIVAITILVYIIGAFVLLRTAPQYLISGNYTLLIVSMILCAFVFITIPNIVYSSYLEDFNLFSESTMFENISNCVVNLLCISGVYVPIFLKNWMVSDQQLSELKIEQESSKVDQFKEQINPASFFKILSRCKFYIKTDPHKASGILIKFSHLLRYQLYDCNRDKVLLTSEITFVRNLLELEKLHSHGFSYQLNVEGNTNGIFIPPLILLPYIQNVINSFDNKDTERRIEIWIDTHGEDITVILRMPDVPNTIPIQKGLLKVRERLNVLYNKRYSLTVSNDKSDNEIEVMVMLALKK